MLRELVKWERAFVEPKPAELRSMIPSEQPDMHSICLERLERVPSGLGNYLTIVLHAVMLFLCLIIWSNFNLSQ